MRRPANPARSSVSIRVLFLALGAAIAAFFPFLALVLKDHGLDAQQIGVAIGAMAVARVVANPLWGHMADARIGRVRAMQLNAAASAAAALVLFASGSAPMAVIVASALFAAASGPLDRWATRSRSRTWAMLASGNTGGCAAGCPPATPR
jgi:MFS family permease